MSKALGGILKALTLFIAMRRHFSKLYMIDLKFSIDLMSHRSISMQNIVTLIIIKIRHSIIRVLISSITRFIVLPLLFQSIKISLFFFSSVPTTLELETFELGLGTKNINLLEKAIKMYQ